MLPTLKRFFCSRVSFFDTFLEMIYVYRKPLENETSIDRVFFLLYSNLYSLRQATNKKKSFSDNGRLNTRGSIIRLDELGQNEL